MMPALTRLIVIGPERSLEEFLTRELRDEVEVIGLRPGPAVVHVVRRMRPHIAVLDRIETRRGSVALEAAILRAARPDVKVILVSAVPSLDDADLVEAGVFYYMPVSPPVRLPEVVRAAARSVREAEQRRARQGELT